MCTVCPWKMLKIYLKYRKVYILLGHTVFLAKNFAQRRVARQGFTLKKPRPIVTFQTPLSSKISHKTMNILDF